MAICRILADHQTGFNAVSKVSMEWIDSNDEDKGLSSAPQFLI